MCSVVLVISPPLLLVVDVPLTSGLTSFLATLISGHCRPTDLCVATAPGKGRRYVRRVGSGHK
jgi:hypothetical protein